MRKRPCDIQREGYAKREDPAITLKKLFDNEGGRAYTWVSYTDKKGQHYGSIHRISRECLEGREYTLSRSGVLPWSIHVLFTDEVYQVGQKMRSLLVIKTT